MAKLYNLARMTTATVGTGTITLAAAATGSLTFAQAGVSDGEVVRYGIKDGANREIGYGTYTHGTLALTRTVLKSTNSNNPISLSGTAEVFITPAAEDFTAPDFVVSVNQGALNPFRNKLINGDFQIDQRSAGSAVTINSATKAYGVDRWFGQGIASAGVFTLQQEADSSNPGQYRLKVACTTADASIAAGDLYFIGQRIEGTNCRDLLIGTANAKQITISFEVESTTTGTYGISLRNSAANRAYVGTFAVNVANTRENKTVTLTLDTSGTWLTDGGIGLELAICLAAGSTYQGTAGAWGGTNIYTTSSQVNFMAANTNIIRFKDIQLERGITATQFETWPPELQLMRCQRYFYRWGHEDADSGTGFRMFGYGGASAFEGQTVRHPVKMRGIPTMSKVGTWTVSNCGQPSTADESTLSFSVSAQVTAAGSFDLYPSGSSDYIQADAEL